MDEPTGAPTLEQLHAYLLAHDWQQQPSGRDGYERWQHPLRDYEDDAMVFPPDVVERDAIWLDGMIETLAGKEDCCVHEVLADMLGRPDPATLLGRIAELEAELVQWRTAFAHINEGVQGVSGMSIWQLARTDSDDPNAVTVAAARKTRDELTAWLDAALDVRMGAQKESCPEAGDPGAAAPIT